MGGIPEVRWAQSGDVKIAYEIVGDGPFDLVGINGMTSHLDVMWELPEFASFLDRVARFSRLIMMDKRGCGLSDRVPAAPALEQRVDDIIAVMDAAGSTRASVAGWADGAFMAAMLAATHPERVSNLVLGSLWVSKGSGDASITPDSKALEQMSRGVVAWRDGLMPSILAPSYADDERFLAWWRRWERYSASPDAAASLLRWAAMVDPAPIFAAIQCPVLVIERADSYGDKESVRNATSCIPQGKYVEVPGCEALPFLGDADLIADEIEQFLTGTRGSRDFDRSLATVLFTDIVGSTQKADQLGDHRWRLLLDDHHGRVRRLLARFRGTEVDTAGDGFFVTFDGPARAIACACAIRDSVREIGLEIRAGLHTGEVERSGATVAGLAVHVGARVASLARAGEVLVTSTVQMLVLGSGITFADRGTHTLKGVPEQWHLFAVETV